jgi:hypothetical protein
MPSKKADAPDPKKPGPQVEHDTHKERLGWIEEALMLGDPTAAAALIAEKRGK